MPFPGSPDTYPTKEQVAGYLNAYAAEFNLPVRLNARITALIAATRQVVLAIATKAPVLPQRLAGKDLFWWLTRLGLMRVTAGSRLGRRLRGAPSGSPTAAAWTPAS
jgi:hypothetical protein